MRKGSVDCCRPLLSGKLAARDDIARSISTVKASHNRGRFVLETATLNWFLRDVEGDKRSAIQGKRVRLRARVCAGV
jgi:hypothetical protein